MSNVVGFPDKGSGPYIEGSVRCLRCKHEWQAVAPPGVFEEFECPVCGTAHGVRTSTIAPADGVVWACNCGNQLFLLTPTGAPMCVMCGLRATSWVDG